MTCRERLRGRVLCTLLVLVGLAAVPVSAAEVLVRVQSDGAGVEDAVVSLHRLDAALPLKATAPAVMDQRNSQFAPRVLPVQAGTLVAFPNHDQIHHQVYSFSQAKPFELPLYAGSAANPVQFERPGVVVVGCNIHDSMIGYIVVVDTPVFGRSASAGTVSLQAPAGRYRLQVWHPRMTGPAHQQTLTVSGGASEVLVALALPPAPAAVPRSDRLRALQDKFRKIEPRP